MAATWIKPIHQQQRGAGCAVKKVADYVMDAGKTREGELVTSYECNAENVADEFMFTKEDYHHFTGRDQGKNEILAYHVRQAFKPGEVDAETVNKLGHELAMELTGGNNAYSVATHVDKKHYHNHIIINAYNLDCERKFVNPIRSYKMLREISDRICLENNLSTIDEPGYSNARMGDQRYDTVSKRTNLTDIIDEVLAVGNPKDFEDMLRQLSEHGCEIKRRGKSFSVKPPMAKRFFRFKTGTKGLPEGYDEQSLRKKIAEMYVESLPKNEITEQETISQKEEHTTKPKQVKSPENVNRGVSEKFKMLIDIENSLKAKSSPGYKKWAMSFNLQHASEMLLFLQNNNLVDYEILSQKAQQATSEYDALQPQIANAEKRMKEIATLQKHIGTYHKTKDVYSQYLRSKRSKDFYVKNEKAINACENAKTFFDSLPYEMLPSVKDLQIEYATLVAEKNQCNDKRREMKQHVLELQMAKRNVELLLDIEPELEVERDKKRAADDER